MGLQKLLHRSIGRGKLEFNLKVHGCWCTIILRVPHSQQFLDEQNNEPQLIWNAELKSIILDGRDIDSRVPIVPGKRLHLVNWMGEIRYPLTANDKTIKRIENRIRNTVEVLGDYEFYFYRNSIYSFNTPGSHTPEERQLLVKEHYFIQEKKFKKLQKEIQLFEKLESSGLPPLREQIPEEVRFTVWRRDSGKCVKYGSKKNLEFDHIIPVSKGGSSTERNIQLLCEKCNREKSDKI